MMKDKPNHSLSIQWHITTSCNNRCRHCYMYDEATYSEEVRHTLSDTDMLKVLNSILEFESKWECAVDTFAVSGGDPLLRKNWYEFLSVLKERNKKIKIMGNPETLTPHNLELLKKLKIEKFQMSLDGLEQMHDYFRSKGSFKRTVDAISALENSGIASQIMFTLYPENKSELFPLIDYLSENTPLKFFYFDIGTLTGNARELNKDFKASDLKSIHEDYLIRQHQLRSLNKKLILGEKSHFFSLIHYEQNKTIYNSLKCVPVVEGCLAGWYSIAILSDGTVLSCRRLPVKIGKMPQQSFEEIFLGSELLKKFRRKSYFKLCGECELYQQCRGCPAYVFSTTGNPFDAHELCFRNKMFSERAEEMNNSEPGLETSYAEEYEFISSAFLFNQNYFLQNLNNTREFRAIYLNLIESRSAVVNYLSDRTSYLLANDTVLRESDLNILSYYFRKLLEAGFYDREKIPNDMMAFISKLKILHLHQ